MNRYLAAFLQVYGLAGLLALPPEVFAQAMRRSAGWPPHRNCGTPPRLRWSYRRAKLSGAKGLRP